MNVLGGCQTRLPTWLLIGIPRLKGWGFLILSPLRIQWRVACRKIFIPRASFQNWMPIALAIVIAGIALTQLIEPRR